jgi:halimadienyl-diphosphate synthase
VLLQVGKGKMSPSAYDTAWVARLGEEDRELSNRALAWLTENQLADGSWGAERPFYYHDRLVSTLAAMIALTYRGRRAQDRARIDHGLLALEAITSDATRQLQSHTLAATAGFEMIVPTLVAEAERLGIIKQQGDRILNRLARQRAAKLAKLEGFKIDRHITTALSAELAGTDSIDMLNVDALQESNGSVANSPSATAYFALYVRPGDASALAYLNHTLKDRGVPFVAPYEIFETIWILWNFMTFLKPDPLTESLFHPHLDYIEQNWRPGKGIGFSSSYSLTDGDDTAVGFELLKRFGRKADIQDVFSYEEPNHFRCFSLEVDASTDVNIHVLGALRAAGYEKDHPSVQKALNYIRLTRINNRYWLDKWNLSPFYTSAHAVVSCLGYDDKLCAEEVNWILTTQKSDGSWGFYDASTAEETAYCLQALSIWRRHGGTIPPGRIEHGKLWLEQHCQPPYPPLWIGKSLYCPELLVKAVILSALKIAGE